jgi:hypothetical protein
VSQPIVKKSVERKDSVPTRAELSQPIVETKESVIEVDKPKKIEQQVIGLSAASSFMDTCEHYEREWKTISPSAKSSSIVANEDTLSEEKSEEKNSPVDSFMKSQAHHLVTTLIRERNRMPVSELPVATELLHRTDKLLKEPSNPATQQAYSETLKKVNGQTNLKQIAGGIALGILGVSLLAGSIALAVLTLGGGTFISLFVAKMSISLLMKAFILAGVTAGSGMGVVGIAGGTAIALDGKENRIVRAAHCFWKSTQPKEHTQTSEVGASSRNTRT